MSAEADDVANLRLACEALFVLMNLTPSQRNSVTPRDAPRADSLELAIDMARASRHFYQSRNIPFMPVEQFGRVFEEEEGS